MINFGLPFKSRAAELFEFLAAFDLENMQHSIYKIGGKPAHIKLAPLKTKQCRKTTPPPAPKISKSPSMLKHFG